MIKRGSSKEIDTLPVVSPVSTATVVSLEEEIIWKKEELDDMVKEGEKEILKKEKEIKYQILGKIYDVIREIAKKEGYTVVLDKSNVLYSEKSADDLTEKVIKKLNKEYKK